MKTLPISKVFLPFLLALALVSCSKRDAQEKNLPKPPQQPSPRVFDRWISWPPTDERLFEITTISVSPPRACATTENGYILVMTEDGVRFEMNVWMMPRRVTTEFPTGMKPVMDRLSLDCMAISPFNANTLYLAYGGIWRNSMSPGWQRWDEEQVYRTPTVLTICPSRRQQSLICAGTENKQGILRSEDGGKSWTRIPYYTRHVFQITEDKNGKFLAATADGFIESADGGLKWTPLSGEFFWFFVVDSVNPLNIFGTPDGDTVMKSTDGGHKWTVIYQGVEVRPNNVSDSKAPIVIHPRNPSVIFVGTRKHGVIRSANGGSTWKAMNDGLSGIITALAIHPYLLNRVYAGTRDGKVFQMDTN